MSDYVYEEQQVGELTVRVYQDEWSDQNPLEDYKPEWLEVVHWHRRHNWGGMTNMSRWSREEIEEYVNRNEVIAWSLYLYEHGQCAFSMTTEVLICRWDSGQVGFVLVDKRKFMEEWGWQRLNSSRQRKMFDAAHSYIKEFDQWQRGEVYGWKISSEDDSHIDSRWGYMGDTEHCLANGVSEAEAIWQRILDERAAAKAALDAEFEELVMGQAGDMLLGSMPPLDYKEKFYDYYG